MADTPSLLGRARNLLMTAVVAPAVLFGVIAVAMAVPDAQNMLIAAGTAVVLGGVGAWIRWGVRSKPDLWQSVASPAVFMGCLLVLFAAGGGDLFGLSGTTYVVVAGVIGAGVALLGWLPARRAARSVLGEVLPEVVDSPLVVSFTARGTDADRLSVTPGTIEVAVRPSSARKTTHSFPLGDVTEVLVRTETDDGEYPVPGSTGKPMRVARGDVLVVEFGDGRLVFAAKDAHRAKEFVGARVRRWAAAHKG